MEAFVWDQDFVTGLSEVDAQHHSLVDMFNDLHRRLFSGQAVDWVVLEIVFQRLLDYAANHFAHEEDLMRRARVDRRHVELHEHAHRDFAQQIRRMWSLRQSLDQPGETIMGFLTSWLGLHILCIDQQMARQLKLIEQGMAAAQAFDQEELGGDESTRALLKMVANLHQVLTQQNRDLVRINQELEGRVQERTAQLAAANEELNALNQRLQSLSRTDSLLQIPNRQHVDERLGLEVARAIRQQEPLAVLMLDVDFFKGYNDTHGHPAGDACLQAVAHAVQGALERQTDFVGRYGGEELVVLLSNTDLSGAELVAQRLLEAVRALALPHPTSEAAAVVTLSIGLCSAIPASAAAGGRLLARADAALYEAKRSGRNRATVAHLD